MQIQKEPHAIDASLAPYVTNLAGGINSCLRDPAFSHFFDMHSYSAASRNRTVDAREFFLEVSQVQ